MARVEVPLQAHAVRILLFLLLVFFLVAAASKPRRLRLRAPSRLRRDARALGGLHVRPRLVRELFHRLLRLGDGRPVRERPPGSGSAARRALRANHLGQFLPQSLLLRQRPQRVVVLQPERIQNAVRALELVFAGRQRLRRAMGLALRDLKRHRLPREGVRVGVGGCDRRAVGAAEKRGGEVPPPKRRAAEPEPPAFRLEPPLRRRRLSPREGDLLPQERLAAVRFRLGGGAPRRQAEELELRGAQTFSKGRTVRIRERPPNVFRVVASLRILRILLRTLFVPQRARKRPRPERGASRAPRLRLAPRGVFLRALRPSLRLLHHGKRRLHAFVRARLVPPRHLLHHRRALRAVLAQELARRPRHLDRLPREARCLRLGGGDEAHDGALAVLVRVRRARRRLRHLALPPRVAVDVRAHHAPQTLRALVPRQARLALLRLGRQRPLRDAFELPPRVGELRLHVHLVRAVPHQHVLLRGDLQEPLRHLLQFRVRRRALVL